MHTITLRIDHVYSSTRRGSAVDVHCKHTFCGSPERSFIVAVTGNGATVLEFSGVTGTGEPTTDVLVSPDLVDATRRLYSMVG